MGKILSDFAAWLWDKVLVVLQWIIDLVESVWLFLLEHVLRFIAWLFGMIPLPDWLSAAQLEGLWAGLPGGVLFFADAMQIPEGVAMVLGAYALRFFVRRLPVVG